MRTRKVCSLPRLDMSADVGGEGLADIRSVDIFGVSRSKDVNTPHPASVTCMSQTRFVHVGGIFSAEVEAESTPPSHHRVRVDDNPAKPRLTLLGHKQCDTLKRDRVFRASSSSLPSRPSSTSRIHPHTRHCPSNLPSADILDIHTHTPATMSIQTTPSKKVR